MTHPAIDVEGLSKAYRIGMHEKAPDTLVSAMAGIIKAPWQNWQRLRRLDTWTYRTDSAANDTLWAINDVSFTVAEGEVIGIVGPNGAGKSTLLKILSRITEPTAGRAVIRGRVSSLLEVGTGFHPELTGRENIYMNGTILGMTKAEIDRKFDEIVDFAGIERFLDTPIKRYSSGMQVRLAFSVAAHLEPEILIIDEVLAVGDVAFQKKCIGKMHHVARSGRTVMFVSHNMAAVEAICSRGLELRGGTVCATGEIAEVIASHRRHAYEQLAASDPVEQLAKSRFFRRLEILNDALEPLPFVEIGRPVQIRLHFSPPRKLADARIRIGIDDVMGHRLLTIQTPANSDALEGVAEPTCVVCRIPEFPLAPGSYSLSLSVAENREMLEDLKSVASLAVENAELFGEGRGFSVGLLAARSEWSTTKWNGSQS